MKFSKLQVKGSEFILVDTFTQTLSFEGREPGEGEIQYRDASRATPLSS